MQTHNGLKSYICAVSDRVQISRLMGRMWYIAKLILCQASALSSINKTAFYSVCHVLLSYIMLCVFKFCMEPFLLIPKLCCQH
jgi:hypothetical protein